MQSDIHTLKRKSNPTPRIIRPRYSNRSREDKVTNAIQSYIKNHGIEEKDIEPNDEFFNYIEKEIDASSLFNTHDEFINTVNKLWVPF